MPVISVTITREDGGATAEQKEAIITGMTKVLVDVLGRGEKTTVVIIEEVDTDNYGIAGESTSRRRQKGIS